MERPEIRDLKDAWRKLSKDLREMKEEESAERLENNKEERGTAVEVLNFFEELAMSIDTGAADEQLIRRSFETVIFW